MKPADPIPETPVGETPRAPVLESALSEEEREAMEWCRGWVADNLGDGNLWAAQRLERVVNALSRLSVASAPEAARGAKSKDCDRCTIWAMYANAAAKALEPLGEAYAFDDPDSLEGAITRLVRQAGWKKLAMEALRFLDADQIATVTQRAGVQANICKEIRA